MGKPSEALRNAHYLPVNSSTQTPSMAILKSRTCWLTISMELTEKSNVT